MTDETKGSEAYGEKEEFKNLCKELNIDIQEYPLCAYFSKPIFGSFTVGDRGDMCFDCNSKKI